MLIKPAPATSVRAQQGVGGERPDDLGRQLARLEAGRLGQAQRDVAAEVAMLRFAGAFHDDGATIDGGVEWAALQLLQCLCQQLFELSFQCDQPCMTGRAVYRKT